MLDPVSVCTIPAVNKYQGHEAVQTKRAIVSGIRFFVFSPCISIAHPSCRQAAHRGLSSSDQAAETNAQLASLHEVSAAADLAAMGRRSEAAPLLERAVEICSGSMGPDSALTRAAMHRYVHGRMHGIALLWTVINAAPV